ncbi:MAG: sterol desaturase family protein [Bacteroidetes bacterium]|nr:sterol desaturase family protein [Bacteroidota bacterium]
MGYVLLFLFALITVEIIWSWRTEKRVYDIKDTFTNLAIFAGYQLSKYLFAGYTLAFLGFFYQYRVHTFEKSLLIFVITFFSVDFFYYWYHRASHVIKLLWAFHLVHHTSQQMNLTVAYRLNWFSFILSPFFYVPLALIGLPPIFIVGAYALNLLYQFFLHTEAVGKLGFLEKIIDTPSSHRVHHGSNDLYIDKNFGGVLIIWDRMFGTYQPEEEKVKYGTTKGFAGHNPIVLVFHGFVDLVRNKMYYKG